ncbi:MAG TPA: redoxin domain-containing protein [Gammaproteobacteria bacterium]
MVALHREIPVLTLPDPAGRRISTWDYKQDKPVVLAFAGGDSALAAKLADRYDEYRKATAEVLLIAPEPPDEDLPFPVLLDADGAAAARYAERTPELLVLDAYGVLEGRFDGAEPDHAAVLGLIAALEMRCPECGVPEWPLEEA